jgi:hypothetical protein
MTRLPSDRRHPVCFRLNGRPVHGEAEPRLWRRIFFDRISGRRASMSVANTAFAGLALSLSMAC